MCDIVEHIWLRLKEHTSYMNEFQSFLKVNMATENWWWNGTFTNGCLISKCQDAKDPKPSQPYLVFFYLLSFSCHYYFNFVIPFTIIGLEIDHTLVGMYMVMNWKTIMETTPNPSSENLFSSIIN
jgi:hypothetical protein